MSKIAVILSSLVLAVACHESKSQTPQTAEAEAHGSPGHMRGMCPMGVPGTQVTAEDTQDGAAFVFTTSGDVARLRERVHAMAGRHSEMQHGGAGRGGIIERDGMGYDDMVTREGMGYGGMGINGVSSVPSSARAVDIPNGARLELMAKDPSEAVELRGQIHARAETMASGQCPMMHHGA